MTPGNTPSSLDDPRVIEALDQYMAALEAGQSPNRQAFLARHAELAGPLAECLDAMQALHELHSSANQPGHETGGADPAGDWQPGTPLGDFRIIREIGRGGMGVVYEAEQLSLSRRIALKVLPFALTLDPRKLERFKNEARAAAHLHHQNIVPVYAVGCERGVHFYAMQFIEGQTLAEVIRELGQAADGAKPFGGTGRRASVAPRSSPAGAETDAEPVGAIATSYSSDSPRFFRIVAKLGMQAAEALEHAHECGVVHRDVKPGNLLVDARGKLWVTDFGLAQFHTDAGLTQSGDLLGTLRYMSPEQAGGQRVLLDHRTDIYSLGATLYELLTRQPLFSGTDRQTLLQQILHDEPRPPRAIDKSVPVDLETIVLKALGKTPAERYSSAQELADDLSRFLVHQPVRARRATFTQRAWKWARRHPSWVAAVVMLCVLTTAVSLVSAALIRGAYEQERQRAQQAEERFLLARESVDEMVRICEQELADRPPFDGLRRRLLEDALGYYQKLIEQRGDDPMAQAELTATRGRVEKILADLAVLQGAGKFHLLDDPAVLDDLRPTEDQRGRLTGVLRRMHEQRMESFREFRQLSPEVRQQRFLDLAHADEAAVAAVLTPVQLRRLQEISLQVHGSHAFQEPEVIAALALTSEQQDHIRAIEAESFFGGPGGPACGPGPDGPRKPPQRPPHGEEVSAILSVLTQEQRLRWQKLAGEPFQGLTRGPPGPPPGHFGGPHR
jgi:serine/threonine protein kinase